MLKQFFLLLCLSSALAAQSDTTETYKRLEFGVGFGMMEHAIDFTPNADVEALLANNIGVTLRYFDQHLVGFQAELSFVQAGWREDLGDGEPLNIYARRTNYAELLLLTQFSIGRGVFQPLVQAGPYLSVPISTEQDLPQSVYFPPSDPPNRYGYEIPFRLNYGGQAGLGFNLRLGRVTIQADGRYLIGFNDIIPTGETTTVISRRTGYGGRVTVLYQVR